MKNLRFFLTSALLFMTLACQEKTSETPPGSTSANARMFVEKKAREAAYDFQKINVPYDFGLPGESERLIQGRLSGTERRELSMRLKERRQFLIQQGFPLTVEEAVKRAPMPWREADRKYRAFVRNNPKPEYEQLFRRNASAYILRDLALLADHSPEGIKAIEYYTKELVNNGGESYTALLYYCIRAMKGNISVQEIETLKDAALNSKSNQQLITHLKNVVIPEMARYQGMTEAQKTQMREPAENLLNEQLRYEALIRKL